VKRALGLLLLTVHCGDIDSALAKYLADAGAGGGAGGAGGAGGGAAGGTSGGSAGGTAGGSAGGSAGGTSGGAAGGTAGGTVVTPPEWDGGVTGVPLAIAAGTYHSCAIRADREVICWGFSGDGSLGAPNGRHPRRARVSDAIELAAGGGYTCAVLTDGGVVCWGRNNYGQTGIEADAGGPAKAYPAGLGPAAHVSAGTYHACAHLIDTSVWCWGNNDEGQLGTATSATELPRMVVASAAAMAALKSDTFVRLDNGTLRGTGDSFLITGTGGTMLTSLTTVPLAFDAGLVGGGESHTCATSASGGLRCWGLNNRWQLGTTAAGPFGPPAAVVTDGSAVTAFTGGKDFTLAVHGQRIYSSGYDYYGQLGINGGDGGTYFVQEPVLSLSAVTAVAAGNTGQHACAIATGDGGTGVYCWGDNFDGQVLGRDGGYVPMPQFMPL
jgi:alpha-tubulin suppressor-like RCC1 family protein